MSAAAHAAVVAGVRTAELSVVVNGTRLLDSVSVNARRGSIVWFVGTSGAGKTTLLEAVAGVSRVGAVVSGSVTLGSQHVRLGTWGGRRMLARLRRAGTIGWAPQNSADTFPPHMPLTAWLAPGPFAREFGLDDQLLARRPHELSGGQMARVSLAAALARKPDVLFVDEPTAGLEADLARTVTAVLARAVAAGTTVLASTHDLGAMARLAQAGASTGDRAGVVSTTVLLRSGATVETTPTERFCAGQARTEYGRAFVRAAPAHGAVPLPPLFDDDLGAAVLSEEESA